MDILNKVEFIKQYRQYVMYSDFVNFFKPVIEKFRKLKVLAMAAVYEKKSRDLVWVII